METPTPDHGYTMRQAVAEASIALTIIGDISGNPYARIMAERMATILDKTLSSYTAMSPIAYLDKYHRNTSPRYLWDILDEHYGSTLEEQTSNQ